MSDIPSRLTAGDSWIFAPAAGDYPDPTWSLALSLVPAEGGVVVSLPGTWADGAWTITAGASVTAAIAAGGYVWSIAARDAADDARVTLGSGAVTVLPDPASGADPRSAAERNLAAIEATLADPDWQWSESYTIEGRSLARRSRADLMALRSHFAAIVRRERGGGMFVRIAHRLAP